MLSREIAESIVRETMKRLRQNINIMNIKGEIIASGDPSRLGERHEGALEVIRSGKPLIIDIDNQANWKGSQCGVNYPIVFLQQIVGSIGITGKPEDVAQFGELVKMTTELMLNQVEISTRQEWRNRTMVTVIEELVKPNSHFAKLDELLKLLQINLDPPFNVWIMQTEKSMEQHPLLIKKIEDIVGSQHLLIAHENPYKAVMIIYGLPENKISDKRELLIKTLWHREFPFHIGCSSKTEAREEIFYALREAEIALKLGNKHETAITYEGLEPLTIIHFSDSDIKNRFAKRIFSGLSETALETLKIFFESNMNILEASRYLNIHKNTLIYRLKKIKETTGYDPQIFREAIILQISTWIIKSKEY